MSTTELINNADQHSPPYYRFGLGDVARVRRKSKILYVINIFLSFVLIVLLFSLLFSVLPRSIMNENTCFWPGPGSRCFWPFNRPHPVLLISMDGFRHDYLEMARKSLGPHALPNFARFQAGGVRAYRSINSFPTVTMPNHQTLITGLHPSFNGIVSNTIFDTKYPNLTLSMDDQKSLNNDPWLVDWPEPIWLTLQKAGGLSGSILWPLTDQSVQNDLPFQQVSQYTLLDSGSSRYPYEMRVRDILWWMDNPRYHMDLVLAYFDEPDETGHAYGPGSSAVARTIAKLDSILGNLLDGMKKHNLLGEVDVILTADHGMAAISRNRSIPLDQYVSSSDYTSTHLSTFGFVYPKPGKEEEVYNNLHGVHEHLQVYWLHEVPKWLSFNKPSSRMPPLVLLPDPGWNIVYNVNTSVSPGNHGYSPNFTDVNPFFMAHGPSFRVNATVDEVHAVDVYPLMCSLLRIQPLPNNGSLARIAPLLLKPSISYWLLAIDHWPRWLIWMTLEMQFLWFLLLLAFSITVAVLLVLFVRKQRQYAMMAHRVLDDQSDS